MAKTKVPGNVEVFFVPLHEFAYDAADKDPDDPDESRWVPVGDGTWMSIRAAEYLRECPDAGEEELEVALEGWYFWVCSEGCLPDSDAFGPYETVEEAEWAASEMFGGDEAPKNRRPRRK